jgi:hypothetical protein
VGKVLGASCCGVLLGGGCCFFGGAHFHFVHGRVGARYKPQSTAARLELGSVDWTNKESINIGSNSFSVHASRLETMDGQTEEP